MVSPDKRNTELKTAILKAVYEDNLRIAGHCTEGSRAVTKEVRWKRYVWVVIAAITAFLSILPNLGPSLSPDGQLTREQFHSQATVAVDPPPLQEPQASPQPPPFNPGSMSMMTQAPVFDFDEFNQHTTSTDYSFFLSDGNDVRLTSLFGLGIKTIVIDPGHGGVDPGAIGTLGTKEKDMTLDIALRLRARLKRMGRYDVLLTRDRDRSISLADRVKFANASKADLFISVHVNSLPNQLVNVIETYYFGPPRNAETLRLSEQENKDSHYAIGDFKAIIQDIGNTVKRQESVRLAASIQKCLYRNMKHYDANVLDIGVKTAPFVVLLGVEAPSVLAEISCITNEEEEAKLASEEYREKVASFLEEGMVRYLSSRYFQKVWGDHEHDREYGGDYRGEYRGEYGGRYGGEHGG